MLRRVAYDIKGSSKGRDGYFTVRWSPIEKAEKYGIVTGVPAVGGIAEIYFMDERGTLNLFCLQRSWYGGLRGMLRERCDPAIEQDPWRLSILVKWRERIYYRWTACDSRADMSDVMFFLADAAGASTPDAESSGRYDRVFVDQIDAGHLGRI
ncbi:MAG: hypothetical protein Q8M76_05550 [Spirochaetaceae bacterium]|nr:hypothetical protein [Spirochaetaceae bacterium]